MLHRPSEGQTSKSGATSAIVGAVGVLSAVNPFGAYQEVPREPQRVIARIQPQPYTYRGAATEVDGMADAALTEAVNNLIKRLDAQASAVKPPYKTVSFWLPFIIPAVVAGFGLIGVERGFSDANKRIDDVAGSVQALDRRLTPAIDKLTEQIAKLDKTLAVNEAKRADH